VIVVTGAHGQLGTAFLKLIPEATGLARDDLNLSEPTSIRPTLNSLRPSLVVNCAAYTAVDAAEKDAENARIVNAQSVRELASTCADIGARFVTFSTDYVFDGSKAEPYVESDPTRPINVYGETKAEGEQAAIEANPDALIIRTSWVLSGTHPNFTSTMLQLAARGKATVVNDQIGRPTMANDLARGTMQVLDDGLTGILHLANQGALSWFELARIVFEMGGFDSHAVEPCASSEFPRPAPRPANSVLNSERVGDVLPHFETELAAAVLALQGASS